MVQRLQVSLFRPSRSWFVAKKKRCCQLDTRHELDCSHDIHLVSLSFSFLLRKAQWQLTIPVTGYSMEHLWFYLGILPSNMNPLHQNPWHVDPYNVAAAATLKNAPNRSSIQRLQHWLHSLPTPTYRNIIDNSRKTVSLNKPRSPHRLKHPNCPDWGRKIHLFLPVPSCRYISYESAQPKTWKNKHSG